MLIPLLFMGDVIGRLFREFAVTLAVAILISAVVSLTLTPMMRAHAERRIAAQAEPLLPRQRAMFDKVIAGYGRWLTRVLRHPWLTLSVALGTLLLTVLLWVVIPKGFSRNRTTASFRAHCRRRSRSLTPVWRSAPVTWRRSL